MIQPPVIVDDKVDMKFVSWLYKGEESERRKNRKSFESFG